MTVSVEHLGFFTIPTLTTRTFSTTKFATVAAPSGSSSNDDTTSGQVVGGDRTIDSGGGGSSSAPEESTEIPASDTTPETGEEDLVILDSQKEPATEKRSRSGLSMPIKIAIGAGAGVAVLWALAR